MQSFLLNGLVLGLLVAVGVAAIVTIRSWWRGGHADRGDWENTLAGYRNLWEQGVLTDEEYRKIRTLVEPHVRSLPMATPRAAAPDAVRAEAIHAIQPSEEQD